MSRNKILEKAIRECLSEMYERSQPSANFEELCEKYPKEQFYLRYYLPTELYKDIVEKYINDYRINSNWEKHIELLENYLTEGGHKQIWIEGEIDEEGNKIPGYKGYKKLDSLFTELKKLIPNNYQEVCNKVFELISECKDFYSSEPDECGFRFAVMNISPNSNKESVVQYWKEQGIDLEIKEYNEEDEEWN